jgi:hypothetical protein
MHEADKLPNLNRLFTVEADQRLPAGLEPDDWHDLLMDQYKLAVEMADRVSARRLAANSFFLTLSTGLVGVAGYGEHFESARHFWLVGLAGIAIAYLWYRVIGSYRDLNTAKYKVIHALESRLPARLYDAEWDALGRGEDPKLYRPFSHIEIGVPWVFAFLHAVFLVQTNPWFRL